MLRSPGDQSEIVPTTAASLAGLFGAQQRRPLYSRLPSLYFRTPAWVKAAARWTIGARRGGRTALVEQYLHHLDDFPAAAGAPVPVLLTHDVDTAQGYAALPRLLRIEEEEAGVA